MGVGVLPKAVDDRPEGLWTGIGRTDDAEIAKDQGASSSAPEHDQMDCCHVTPVDRPPRSADYSGEGVEQGSLLGRPRDHTHR